jgi:hypothetical protein
MEHRKDERVGYCNGIQDFRSFGQSEIQKLNSIQPQFCTETEINSEVNLKNFVTSKPFGGELYE